MMIDRIYRTVRALVNTDGRGNFKVTDFNDFLWKSMMEKVESYVVEINQAVNRQNRGLVNDGLENIPDRLREKLLYLLKSTTMTTSSGIANLPADQLYFDTIITAAGDELEMCKNAKEFNLYARNNASKDFPIFLKLENQIKISPTTIPGALTIYYIRKPKYPKWTYAIVNNNPVFNPSATDFQDVDLHPTEEDDLVEMVCFKFGINLKEMDVQSALNTSQQQEENKNITS